MFQHNISEYQLATAKHYAICMWQLCLSADSPQSCVSLVDAATPQAIERQHRHRDRPIKGGHRLQATTEGRLHLLVLPHISRGSEAATISCMIVEAAVALFACIYSKLLGFNDFLFP